jgi:hypothetical protein
MTAMTIDRLRELSRLLLDEGAAEPELKRACRELFTELSGIAGRESIAQATADTPLSSGLALSPAGAAACIDDPLRTAMFARGVHGAVAESRLRFPGTCIEVIYAGCGPFASLVLPLMAVSSPEQVRFTLIDIHSESIRSVEALLFHFALTPFIRRTVVGDAAEYVHPRDLPPLHVAVMEVLQEALANEPQVAVTRQMVPQLTEGGFLVPEEITVDLVLENPQVLAGMDEREAVGEPRAPVGRVMTLDRSLAMEPETEGRLPLATLEIPRVPENALPAYITTIGVFRSLRLAGRDCCLTIPVRIPALNDVQEGERVAFHYQLGPRPGIGFERSRHP